MAVFQITRKQLWEKIKELKGDEASPNQVPLKVFKSNAKEAFFNKLEFVFIDPGTLSPDTLNKIDTFLEGFVRNFKRCVAEFDIVSRVVTFNPNYSVSEIFHVTPTSYESASGIIGCRASNLPRI